MQLIQNHKDDRDDTEVDALESFARLSIGEKGKEKVVEEEVDCCIDKIAKVSLSDDDDEEDLKQEETDTDATVEEDNFPREEQFVEETEAKKDLDTDRDEEDCVTQREIKDENEEDADDAEENKTSDYASDKEEDEGEAKKDESVKEEGAKKVVKEKKLLARGLGPIIQGDSHHSQLHQAVFNNFPNDSSDCFSSQYIPQQQMYLAMSPLQAMTPPSYGMSLSPVAGYTDTDMYGSYQDDSEFYGQTALAPEMQSSVYYQPPSVPPYEIASSPDVQPHPTLFEVLEAINNVENNPDSCVAPEDVIPIRNQLVQYVECSEPSGLEKTQELLCSSSPVDPAFANTLQTTDLDNSYPLSPAVKGPVEREIHSLIDAKKYSRSCSRMALIHDEALTTKDAEGDTKSMVVACQEENTDRFYENLLVTANRIINLDICCEMLVSSGHSCKICGNSDRTTFYSPFTMENNMNENMLKSVLSLSRSQLVVNFILECICQRSSDVERTFGRGNADFYQQYEQLYPYLGVILTEVRSMWSGRC